MEAAPEEVARRAPALNTGEGEKSTGKWCVALTKAVRPQLQNAWQSRATRRPNSKQLFSVLCPFGEGHWRRCIAKAHGQAEHDPVGDLVKQLKNSDCGSRRYLFELLCRGI
jgi:hypothetical protein